jgi:hypothetical protein
MKIVINYSKCQLEKAVDFIATNNIYFKNQHELIRNTIKFYIKRLAEHHEPQYIGTMGFMLIADREFENIECEANSITITILVEPDLGDMTYYNLSDVMCEEIIICAKEYWND